MALVEAFRDRWLSKSKFQVEVAYARPDRQLILRCRADASMRLKDVIESSGILRIFPEIDLSTARVGVYGRLRSIDDRVSEGDRIQIYRPLKIDPKESRRRRAAARKKSS